MESTVEQLTDRVSELGDEAVNVLADLLRLLLLDEVLDPRVVVGQSLGP
jgi:hypothetical protein